MLNFDFLEKGLGIVSPPHFENYFSRKNFLMLNSINWPNFIIWLPVLFEVLANIYCNCLLFRYINFEINLIFLIKLFLYMIQKSRQNMLRINILRTKTAFKVKWKPFLIIFKALSIAKKIVSDLIVRLQGYNEGLFLLTSYIVLDYYFE